jgi:hypothetical protein
MLTVIGNLGLVRNNRPSLAQPDHGHGLSSAGHATQEGVVGNAVDDKTGEVVDINKLYREKRNL